MKGPSGLEVTFVAECDNCVHQSVCKGHGSYGCVCGDWKMTNRYVSHISDLLQTKLGDWRIQQAKEEGEKDGNCRES